MLLDNKNENPKICEWANDKTITGEMDIVTGYFTIGALAWFSQKINNRLKSCRLILGDIANKEPEQERIIDLLNENITIEAALNLSAAARQAVAFLQQENIRIKTLEPNFCHAKAWIYKDIGQDPAKSYHIFGSSNLTEAGIGLKETHNLELNMVNMGTDAGQKQLTDWFNNLWNSPEAHRNKTLTDEKGHKTVISIKNYLIEKIRGIFRTYTPGDIYYKILFELFSSTLLPDMENPRFRTQVRRLEDTEIFKSLYEFQKKAALSLIKMLQNHDGAILADAVGLGKTWTALAVIKFFQMQGREVLLLCPKKLEHNWLRFRQHQQSRFEADELNYFIRFHTDMIATRLEADKYRSERADTRFTSDKPRLLVIDESHNFRNSGSGRYEFLVEEILKKNPDIKVLMLSATPINCSLLDIRNQFLLIKKNNPAGFRQTHNINNLDYLFKQVEATFNKWKQNDQRNINEFIESLPGEFTRFSDSLVVARTRAMIESPDKPFSFPRKNKPQNIYITPEKIGQYTEFQQLLDDFPPSLSVYQPSKYTDRKAKRHNVLHDQIQREFSLIRMLWVLLIKRLESSWKAFQITIQRICDYHQETLDMLEKYKKTRAAPQPSAGITTHFEDNEIAGEMDDEIAEEEWLLGRKGVVSLREIDQAGGLQDFASDLARDIQSMKKLLTNLEIMENEVRQEVKNQKEQSIDSKLESLIKQIHSKRREGKNGKNPKVLIFTAYKDTARYLYDQLSQRGLDRIAWVGGDGARACDMEHETQHYEPLLDRFAPWARLYLGRKWDFSPTTTDLKQGYREWKKWIKQNDSKTAELIARPIDILIATDVLSEGQNFQDCDMVINYDIHWNPVRVIQRMGRIDRLGSPNDEISGINYWPGKNIDEYLGLGKRVEDRMVMMLTAGSEVNKEFTRAIEEITGKTELERKMKERMLRQMEISWDDIENNSASLSFDNLSLEEFRQDLSAELQNKMNVYKNMPRAVYTGFQDTANPAGTEDWGIVALMGTPPRPPSVSGHSYEYYELVYVDRQGIPRMSSWKEILDYLARHRDAPRHVPNAVDTGEPAAIAPLVQSLDGWFNRQARREVHAPDGSKTFEAGEQTIKIIRGLQAGSTRTAQDVQKGHKVAGNYSKDQFDLIAWFRVG